MEYTFVRGSNASVLWDEKRDAPLAEFNKQGIFKTNDPKVAKRLKDWGYQEMKEFPNGPPSEGFVHKKPDPHPEPKVDLTPGDGPVRKPDIEEEEQEVVTTSKRTRSN